MPIYEYECAKCGQRSEHLMKHDDPDPKHGDDCDSSTCRLVRIPISSGTDFRLSGEGWYETTKTPSDSNRRRVGPPPIHKPHS